MSVISLKRRYGRANGPVPPYTVHGVLAGAYHGRRGIEDRALLTHVLLEGRKRSPCGLSLDESLCDVEEKEEPTCPRCRKRVRLPVEK